MSDNDTDTLGAVLDDAREVFEYRQDSRPQDRAHAYLVEHRVQRGMDDTAMLCAVRDMLRRACAVGVAEGSGGAAPAPGGSAVDSPAHYTAGAVETIDKVEAVTDGLDSRAAVALGNVIKYCDRAGLKGDAAEDLAKANNYAHRLLYHHWRGGQP